ncbi:MAG: hypothetical protein ACREBQ_11180 [Nitrososphaerales archaeon]
MRITLFLTIKGVTMIVQTVEMVMFLAVIVALAAIVAIATYVGIWRRHTGFSQGPVSDLSQSSAADPEYPVESRAQTQATDVKEKEVVPTQEPSFAALTPATVSAASAPIQEAPAPFPEESTSTTAVPTPTDVTALANIASPVDAASHAVLVIPTPKRRVRTKRLPTGASPPVPRKRRSARNKPTIPETPTFTETDQSFIEPQAFTEAQSTGTAGQQKE